MRYRETAGIFFHSPLLGLVGLGSCCKYSISAVAMSFVR
jgi:hypothetical protein